MFKLTEPLWTGPGLRSETGVRDIISTLKKKRKKKALADVSETE